MNPGGFKEYQNHHNGGLRGGNRNKKSKKINILGEFIDGKSINNVYTFPIIQPRDYQLPVWKFYNRGVKTILLSMPRRHGKDLTSTSIAVDYALRNPHSSIVLLAPTKQWARRIWWEKGQSFEVKDPITALNRKIGGSLLDVCLPKNCRQSTNNTEAKITLHNGSTIQLYGSDEGAFIGMKINFVVVSEMAQHKPEIFPLLSPILEEANGVAIYNGTVTDENNHYWKMIQNVKDLEKEGDDAVFCHYLTIEDTKTAYWVSDPDPVTKQREFNINSELVGKINPRTGAPYTNINRRLKLGENKSYLIREYLNFPTFTEEGSYYDECLKFAFEEGRISDLISWNPNLPVCTAWDIGHSDKTCIVFFQTIEDEIYIVDYYEENKKGPDHFIDIIRSKPYKYKAHFAPHDITQKKWGMKQSALDLCRDEYNFVFLKIPRSNSTVDDINIVRSYLQKCKISRTPCKNLINALMKYRENPNTQKPEHDEFSHGADAFRYAILSIHKSLIPAHDLMGNNDYGKNRWKKQKMVKNVDEIKNLPISNDGFVTNVETMERFFGEESTWLGDIYG